MAVLAAFELMSVVETSLYILSVAVGLGLVIFFHELGHFLVAKWCDVHVERFSIGFGPILWSRKRGETEYALSAIPFGGYVKMLGQDDIDPSQLTSEEIATDPRSYSAKTVPQRMAIISAGVIMNVLTAVIFFSVAFGLGVESPPSTLGALQIGYPAWEAGLQQGDKITEINGREVNSFQDIMRGVALSSGPVEVKGVHKDGAKFDLKLVPNTSGPRRIIGVSPAMGLTTFPARAEIPPALPGTIAAQVQPAFQPGDEIVKVDGNRIHEFAEFQAILSRKRSEPITLAVRRRENGESSTEQITLPPSRFRTLGLRMDIGRISSIVNDSPAKQNGIEVGDKILRINSQEVGTMIDPLQLPDTLAALQGQEITITVLREVKGGDGKSLDIRLVPTDKPGWVERPLDKDHLLSAPSIGVAYPVIPTVLHVDSGSPAEEAGIEKGERVLKASLAIPEGEPVDVYGKKPINVPFDGKEEVAGRPANWAYVFWMMQKAPTRNVVLTVSRAGEPREVTLTPRPDTHDNWFVPDERGLQLMAMQTKQQADGIVDAVGLGLAHTENSISNIYLTLRNLGGGELSYKELHGPLGIAHVAYMVAQQGLPELLLFLGFLSVNLAVLNFLPIPVLDGGHMVFLIWEGVTRKRPSERVLVAATYCGMAFVLCLMMLVLYLDIFEHKIVGN